LKKNRNEDVVSMKNAIDAYLKAMGIDEKMHETAVLAKWELLMGEAVAKRTEKKYIKSKVLYLEINSAVMRDELMQSKQKIIDKINALAEKELIVDIFFR
jgi:hypothetical protein